MADNGKLYAAFDDTFPAEMAKVCAKADIILPNITEACLLTGTPYRTEYGPDYIRSLMEKLLKLGCKTAALTGVSGEWPIWTAAERNFPILPAAVPRASMEPGISTLPPYWAD